jgi:hypothetical protein
MGFWHTVFTVFKFLFGLGALCALIGLGCVLGWFFLRFLVKHALLGQPAHRYPRLRKLFLEP